MTEKVTLGELRRISNLLFDYLEECGHDAIELDKDYYWAVSDTERYDPYNEPKRVYLGQLYEDWQGLQDIADGKSPPIAHALVWLSSVMTYIGERIVK